MIKLRIFPIGLRAGIVLLGMSFAFQAFAQQDQGVQQVSYSVNVGALSDYVFRGVSQSDEDPVLQGSLDVISPSGVYAGLWLSGIDRPWGTVYNQIGGDEDLEYDVYLGWTKTFDNQFSVDTGLIRYSFTPDRDDLSWSEFYASIGYRDLQLKVSTRIEGADMGDYVEAAYRINVKDLFDINLHAGHYFLNRQLREDPNDEYSDFSVGLGKTLETFHNVRVDLAYHYTDHDGRHRYLRAADDRVVLTIRKNFDLQELF